MASIVIVEDHPPVLKLLSSVCREQGHDVMAFDNSQAGLTAIAELQPEIALIDRRLGQEDGLEIVQKTRQTSPQTRCVMVTGCTDTKDIVLAMRRGAFNYITKPFESSAIHQAVQEALENPPEPVMQPRQKLVIVYPKAPAA